MIELDFKKSGGLIPAIAQDWKTGEVLMLAYINEESWKETLRTGHGVYWSRSRSKLWHKGEESGNVQIVKEILVETAAGEKLGYVPRKHNRILARLMDAGKQLIAKVVHKELEDHWLNMRIAIDMKEV